MNELIIRQIEERETWGSSILCDSSNVGIKARELQIQVF